MQKEENISSMDFADHNIFGNSDTAKNNANAVTINSSSEVALRQSNKNDDPAKHQMCPKKSASTGNMPSEKSAEGNLMGSLDSATELVMPVCENATNPAIFMATDTLDGAACGNEVSGVIVSANTEKLFKHQLENTWTLWYLQNDRTKSWKDMQNEITSFNTVEDFWSLYHHIKGPSELKLGSDYSMFKKGIRPMWEDDQNKMGGRWIITVTRNTRKEVDDVWLNVLLVLIGEVCDYSHDICGAVINVRAKNNKISVWTCDGYNQQAALEIGNKLRELCQLGRQSMQYKLHQDTMHQQSSTVKSVYTL